MPIYEYHCQACGKDQSLLFLTPREAATPPRCQYCGARRLTRLLSRFAYHQTETARLKDFDTNAHATSRSTGTRATWVFGRKNARRKWGRIWARSSKKP